MTTDLAHDLRSTTTFEEPEDGPVTQDARPVRGPSPAAQGTEQAPAAIDAQIMVLAGGGPAPLGSGDGAVVRRIPTEQLHPGQLQPRHRFDEDALRALADSIEDQGMLQPIVVRPHPHREGRYEIVAGERRWRAARLVGKANVPAIVRTLSDRQTLGLALVENLQRRDLTPIEVAEGYRRLIEEHGYSHDHVARLVGKSRSQVANTLRLLSLPAAVKQMLHDGALSAGHARALLGAERPEELARHIVAEGLSVRHAERLARVHATRAARARNAQPARTPQIEALERELSHLLGVRASIAASSKGGALTLHYASLGEVKDLLLRLRAARETQGAQRRRREPESPRAVPSARGAAAASQPTRNVDAYGPAPDPLPQQELMVQAETSHPC